MKKKLIAVLLICVCFIGSIPVKVRAFDERDLLARAIEAEASGESYTVMVSLASVLLNRVESAEYPSSLGAVITDAGIDVSDAAPSSQARRAAKDALLGFDPTDGALEYSKETDAPPFIRLKTAAWCFY